MLEVRKLKVLHIITRLDPGGSSTNTLQTVARLDKTSFEAELLAGRTNDPTGEAEAFIAQSNIRAMFLDMLVREVQPFKDVVAFFQIWQIIRRGHYDIVHTHSSKAGILGRWAAFFAGVRKIVHTPHGHVFYGYFSKGATQLFLALERQAARISSRLIALTPGGIDEHCALGVGKRVQWTAIPSGIDVTHFTFSPENRAAVRQEFGIKQDDLVFMTLARLEAVKGIVTLVEAFALIARGRPQMKLFIVGDGTEREALYSQAEAAGIAAQVIWAGFRKDAARVLCAGDIFVMPSLNEGMGRAALEAMATGLPVIATRVGGLPSIIEDGQEGLLVPPQDASHLAEAMRKLGDDPALRARMAVAARVRVDEAFSVQLMVRKIEEVYKTI